MYVTVRCSRCPAALQLMVQAAAPDRNHNIMPDTRDVVRQLKERGWSQPPLESVKPGTLVPFLCNECSK